MRKERRRGENMSGKTKITEKKKRLRKNRRERCGSVS